MEAGWEDSLPERMLEEPEKTLAGIQEEMTELYGQSQEDRVTEELPSLSSPLFNVQETNPQSNLIIKNGAGVGGSVRGGGDARSVAGKQERKAVCLVEEEVEFCDLTTLGPRSTSWGQS